MYYIAITTNNNAANFYKIKYGLLRSFSFCFVCAAIGTVCINLHSHTHRWTIYSVILIMFLNWLNDDEFHNSFQTCEWYHLLAYTLDNLKTSLSLTHWLIWTKNLDK